MNNLRYLSKWIVPYRSCKGVNNYFLPNLYKSTVNRSTWYYYNMASAPYLLSLFTWELCLPIHSRYICYRCNINHLVVGGTPNPDSSFSNGTSLPLPLSHKHLTRYCHVLVLQRVRF